VVASPEIKKVTGICEKCRSPARQPLGCVI
jgi:hypothetical protein